MKKSFKQALLASAVIGLAGVTMAQASTKDGFYLTPNAQVLFVDKKFTKENGIGIGFGGGAAFGYQVQNFQIDLNADYQYYGGKGSVKQAITDAGQYAFGAQSIGTQLATLAAGGMASVAIQQLAGLAQTAQTTPTAANIGAFNNAFYAAAAAVAATGAFIGTTNTTTTDSKESFVPVTLGLKYVIPLMAGGVLSMTPGIAGGVWFHSVDRTSTSVITLANGTVLSTTVTKDKTDEEAKGVIVPSISFDYAPSQNVTISLAGKVYIVPGGYSDNYSITAQELADQAKDLFAPAYFGVKQDFWYGGVNLAVQYTF